MRMIYLDESGRDDQFYFFGALIVDAAAITAIEAGVNGVAELLARQVPGFAPSTEFHAVDMFHGKGAWKSVPVVWRVKAAELVSKIIARSSAEYVFRGIDLEALRRRYRSPHPPHLLTLAHVLQGSDRRLSRTRPGPVIGLVHADEHHSAANARRSLRGFRRNAVAGYTNRPIEWIADTIYFGPSDQSRLLQATDLATYFMNRFHTVEEGDERSARAIARIVRNIDSITVDSYIWVPEKNTTPRRSRGVG